MTPSCHGRVTVIALPGQISEKPHFVEGELARRLRALPDRADHAELLAWLLDRAPAPRLGPW